MYSPTPTLDNLPCSVRDALRAASTLLAAQGGTARLEAELLLADVLGTTRTMLHTHPERLLDEVQSQRYATLIARRAQGEPCAYLTGRREFWSLMLAVTPATLIPRPETEHLVALALEHLPQHSTAHIADLGTGSGAIALAIAHERPHTTLHACDHSRAALAVAAHNTARLGLANLRLVESDWLAAFADTSLDMIVSNPPYVCASDPRLAEGDVRFEPQDALVAGPDGLDAIRTIAAQAPHALRPGGWLLVEHGMDQGDAVCALLAAAGFIAVTTHRDLAGLPRVTCGHLR
jgi:release factor glutamine methyltransferase